MYRVALESVLGFRLKDGAFIELKPCMPAEWPEFAIHYRHPENGTRYAIRVRNPNKTSGSIVRADLDGRELSVEQGTVRIPLYSDGARHEVAVTLG